MNKYNLFNADCLEKIKEFDIGSVDMILTDPPYEISNSSGGLIDKGNRNFIREIDNMGMAKSNFDVIGYLNSTIRLFKHKQLYNGIFFCSLKQLDQYIKFAIDNSFQYGLTYWLKSDPAPLCNGKYLNDVELCIYIKGNKARIGGNYKSKSMVYSSFTNRKDKKLYGHPTIKPIELIEKYVINHSKESDVILDTFMGSGTTGVACMNLSRYFIGIEQDEKYFNISKARIEDAIQSKSNGILVFEMD